MIKQKDLQGNRHMIWYIILFSLSSRNKVGTAYLPGIWLIEGLYERKTHSWDKHSWNPQGRGPAIFKNQKCTIPEIQEVSYKYKNLRLRNVTSLERSIPERLTPRNLTLSDCMHLMISTRVSSASTSPVSLLEAFNISFSPWKITRREGKCLSKMTLVMRKQ